MATKTTKKTVKKSARAVKPPRIPKSPQQERPFLRSGTWGALAAIVLVIAGVFYVNRQAEVKANATPTPGEEETFVFEEDVVVTGIEIAPAEGDAVRLERNDEKEWALTKPEKTEASQGAAEAAASQIGALKIILPIENAEDPAVFGFDKPDYVITVDFEDGTTSVLEVGDLTPSENGYYVRVDGEKVYVTALSGIDALTSLTIFPPYLNTPTPSPTATFTPLPTETPAPTSEASSTPGADSTPASTPEATATP